MQDRSKIFTIVPVPSHGIVRDANIAIRDNRVVLRRENHIVAMGSKLGMFEAPTTVDCNAR